MLKRMYYRKVVSSSLALLVLLLIYLMPSNNDIDYQLEQSSVEYIYDNSTEVVYLLDEFDYIARTTIKGCDCTPKEEALDVIESLIIDGKKNHIIPNGFRSLIPSGTEVLDVSLEDKILTINFSKDIMNVNEEYEERMIEAIVYTLTSIDGIDKVVIKVEGKVLEYLPNSNKTMPTILDRGYGINKSYDIVNTNNIDSYTVYYVSNINDNNYYVPITKYVNNNNQDKIKVIIDELSSSPIYEANLMSYLSSNVSLIDYSYDDNILSLNFNNSILSDNTSNNILEEVIYTISLSALDNYDAREVVFLVDNKEIYRNSTKTLEQ